MEARNRTAGDRDKEQRPDRQLFRMQVLKCHLRHDVTADTEEHAAHDAERHDDQADAEDRIKPRDDLVDRQERRHRVVDEDHAEPHKYFHARKL